MKSGQDEGSVLVTGGNGFVGGALVSHLLATQWRPVIAAVRCESASVPGVPKNGFWQAWNRRLAEQAERAGVTQSGGFHQHLYDASKRPWTDLPGERWRGRVHIRAVAAHGQCSWAPCVTDSGAVFLADACR